MSGNFLEILLPETVTECNPIGTDENINGVTSPVSLPSRDIAAPGGSLATRKNPLVYLFQQETDIGCRYRDRCEGQNDFTFLGNITRF